MDSEILELGASVGRNIVYLQMAGYRNISGIEISQLAVINQIKLQKPQKIIVTCSVMPDTTVEIISQKYPEISFYIFRISSNKYVGKGKTDTGNRLFGTY